MFEKRSCLHEQAHVTAIFLCKLDQVGGECSGSLDAELIDANVPVLVGIGSLDDAIDLLVLQPFESQRSESTGNLIARQLAVLVQIGDLEQRPEDCLSKGRVVRRHKVFDEVGMKGDDLGTKFVELLVAQDHLSCVDDGTEDSCLVGRTASGHLLAIGFLAIFGADSVIVVAAAVLDSMAVTGTFGGVVVSFSESAEMLSR